MVDLVQGIAPEGLLESLSEEERSQLGRTARRTIGFGLLSNRPLAAQQQLRTQLQEQFQSRQAAEDLQRFQNFVLNNPDFSDAQRRRLLLIGPENARSLLAESGATLDPGDRRVGPLGTEQARNPTKDVQEFERARQEGFRGTFQEFQDRNQRTEVSPGEAVLGPNNELLFRNPTAARQNVAAGQDVRRSFNAVNTQSGEQLGQVVETTDGRFFQINEAGERIPIDGRNVREISTSVEGSRRDTIGPGADIDLSGTASVERGVDVEDTTAVGGALRRVVNQITDIIGVGAVAGNTDKARIELNNFNQLAKLRVADNVTEGRRSNLLIEMIDSLTADPASILQGTDNARNQLEALDRAFGQIVSEQQFILDNPRANSERDVQVARRKVNAMNGLRKDVQIMLEGFDRDGDVPAADAGPPPEGSGLTQSEFNVLAPEEREALRQAFQEE